MGPVRNHNPALVEHFFREVPDRYVIEAARKFNVPINMVTHEQREAAKKAVYKRIYG